MDDAQKSLAFETAFKFVMSEEKGLEENPNDPGGITNLGVSLRTLKALTPDQLQAIGLSRDVPNADTIRALILSVVKAFYKTEFWDQAPFDEIPYQVVTNYLFDCAVNIGIAPAVKCLQRAIWAVAKSNRDLPDDGVLGPRTLTAINRSGIFLVMALRSERAGYYRLIAAGNDELDTFLDGWLNRAYEA